MKRKIMSCGAKKVLAPSPDNRSMASPKATIAKGAWKSAIRPEGLAFQGRTKSAMSPTPSTENKKSISRPPILDEDCNVFLSTYEDRMANKKRKAEEDDRREYLKKLKSGGQFEELGVYHPGTFNVNVEAVSGLLASSPSFVPLPPIKTESPVPMPTSFVQLPRMNVVSPSSPSWVELRARHQIREEVPFTPRSSSKRPLPSDFMDASDDSNPFVTPKFRRQDSGIFLQSFLPSRRYAYDEEVCYRT
ncbi:hypothetical protein HDU97_008149 [Phlyctochytrium planicorne]|nr:hypothetical protein HDU97_008149 [Phlyctochytrium planicorne]